MVLFRAAVVVTYWPIREGICAQQPNRPRPRIASTNRNPILSPRLRTQTRLIAGRRLWPASAAAHRRLGCLSSRAAPAIDAYNHRLLYSGGRGERRCCAGPSERAPADARAGQARRPLQSSAADMAAPLRQTPAPCPLRLSRLAERSCRRPPTPCLSAFRFHQLPSVPPLIGHAATHQFSLIGRRKLICF
jgi:hypothetical protein